MSPDLMNRDLVNRDLVDRALLHRALWTNVARAFRRTAVPLAAYYAVALGVPLANGAASAGAAFVDHAWVVLVIPPAMILAASVVQTAADVGRGGVTVCRLLPSFVSSSAAERRESGLGAAED